jgi:hypothetical protein
MNARWKFSDSLILIKSIRTSGTITPSSNRLIRRLLASIDGHLILRFSSKSNELCSLKRTLNSIGDWQGMLFCSD